MNTEERAIYKERIAKLYNEVLESWEIYSDGTEVTLGGMSNDHPLFITRMNLACDIFMTDKLAEKFKNIHDELVEIRSKFGEDDNAE